MIAAPSPTNTADRALREAPRELDVAEIADRIALLYNPMPDMSGRQINRLHGRQRRLVEDLAADIVAPIAALRAEIYRLKGEAETFKAGAHREINHAITQIGALKVERKALASELGRTCGDLMTARVALVPFARAAANWDAAENDGHEFHDSENVAAGESDLTVGHLRAARAALQEPKP